MTFSLRRLLLISIFACWHSIGQSQSHRAACLHAREARLRTCGHVGVQAPCVARELAELE